MGLTILKIYSYKKMGLGKVRKIYDPESGKDFIPANWNSKNKKY